MLSQRVLDDAESPLKTPKSWLTVGPPSTCDSPTPQTNERTRTPKAEGGIDEGASPWAGISCDASSISLASDSMGVLADGSSLL
ncbi:hypothetical protein CDV36_002797 [Fusarium kuroshium]|uniref:Uncharacterized protein n=1 Tax=Fusarium kuroshium TaxID=2010991 RepID=A0A3M2SIZ9_9HYPO|nr:hypothetical protein CDV36_002797 [Fusarium kuroshium]